MIRAKLRGSRLAPPTKAPSIFFWRIRSSAFSGFTLPPYWMRIRSAVGAPQSSERTERIKACACSASAGVADRPVPMAHMVHTPRRFRADPFGATPSKPLESAFATPPRYGRHPVPGAFRPHKKLDAGRPPERLLTFRFTISSVSPNNIRRSLCPTMTYLT